MSIRKAVHVSNATLSVCKYVAPHSARVHSAVAAIAAGGATLFRSSFITYVNSHHLRQRPSRSNENCRQRLLTLSPDVTGAAFHPTHQLSVSPQSTIVLWPSPTAQRLQFFFSPLFIFFLFSILYLLPLALALSIHNKLRFRIMQCNMHPSHFLLLTVSLSLRVPVPRSILSSFPIDWILLVRFYKYTHNP